MWKGFVNSERLHECQKIVLALFVLALCRNQKIRSDVGAEFQQGCSERKTAGHVLLLGVCPAPGHPVRELCLQWYSFMI